MNYRRCAELLPEINMLFRLPRQGCAAAIMPFRVSKKDAVHTAQLLSAVESLFAPAQAHRGWCFSQKISENPEKASEIQEPPPRILTEYS